MSGEIRHPTNRRTGFPIYDSPLTEDRLASKIGRPKDIPADMRTALESAQPYSGGNAPLLTILRDLDDLDKHRFPPLVTVGGVVSDFDVSELHADWVWGPELGPVEDGAPIMRWAPKEGTHPVDMQFRCTNHVAFGEASPAEGREPHVLLREIRDYIMGDVLPSFGSFL